MWTNMADIFAIMELRYICGISTIKRSKSTIYRQKPTHSRSLRWIWPQPQSPISKRKQASTCHSEGRKIKRKRTACVSCRWRGPGSSTNEGVIRVGFFHYSVYQCSGSWYGSVSANPCFWLTDPDTDPAPDPAFFVRDLKDAFRRHIYIILQR